MRGGGRASCLEVERGERERERKKENFLSLASLNLAITVSSSCSSSSSCHLAELKPESFKAAARKKELLKNLQKSPQPQKIFPVPHLSRQIALSIKCLWTTNGTRHLVLFSGSLFFGVFDISDFGFRHLCTKRTCTKVSKYDCDYQRL